MNLNKLSRNFVGTIRTTTTTCRVSFIDLYLVFPTNFTIVFSPHTNTVILHVQWYCGTFTEPGLPVSKLHAHVRVIIYEIMTADQKSLHTEKQQEMTQLNIHETFYIVISLKVL